MLWRSNQGDSNNGMYQSLNMDLLIEGFNLK
jgi:hypothetical protein